MIAEFVQQRAIIEASGRRKSDPAHILSKSRVIEETRIAFAVLRYPALLTVSQQMT
jgi:hypothetical protein